MGNTIRHTIRYLVIRYMRLVLYCDHRDIVTNFIPTRKKNDKEETFFVSSFSNFVSIDVVTRTMFNTF